MTRFNLSESQAQAILDMQLRRLAALERQKIEDEHKEVLSQIAYLEDLLASPKKVLALIKTDLTELAEKYGDDRRTQIAAEASDEMTEEERDSMLLDAWQYRQPLYNVYATSLMVDYAPDFAKLHRWSFGTNFWGGDQVNTMMLAVQNMHSYMMLGWETGILNTFHTLSRNGLTKQQIMEIIMFSQLYAGMRGLGHVYRAAGDLLAVFWEPPVPVVYPPGWAPDPHR